MRDTVDNLVDCLKLEIESGNGKRVWSELAKLIAKHDLVEHLESLEKACSASDVVESAEDYIKGVKGRLEREEMRDDLLSSYLGVEPFYKEVYK